MVDHAKRVSIEWFDQAVLVALCLAEASVVWLIASAIVSSPEGGSGRVPFWLVFSMIWCASLLPDLLDARDVWDVPYRIATIAGIVATTAIAIKLVSGPEFAVSDPDWLRHAARSLIFRPNNAAVSAWIPIGVSAYAWWRGKTRSDPTIDSVFRLLRAGIAALLCGAFALAAVREESGDSAVAVGLFVISALAAIGLVRLKQSEVSGGVRIGSRSIVVALLPVCLVIALGIVITGLLSRDLLETIGWALSPMIWALGVVVRSIVLTVALIALILMTPIFWLLEGREFKLSSVRFNQTGPSDDNLIRESSKRAAEMPDALRYVIVALVLFALFQGVTRFVLRRRKRREHPVTEEERTTLRPVFELSRWLAALLDALRRGRNEQPDDPLADLRRDPRWAATVRIRERYREFLVWAGEIGAARRSGATPHEHGASLKRARPVPHAHSDIDAIVDIYAAARYGADPAPAADADAIDIAWRRLNDARPVKR